MRFLRLWLKSCTLYFIFKQPVPGCQIYYSKSWACTSCAQGRHKIFWESFPIPCELLLSSLSSAFLEQEHFSTTRVRPSQALPCPFQTLHVLSSIPGSPHADKSLLRSQELGFMSFRGLWALLLKPITGHANFSALHQTVNPGHKIPATRDLQEWWTPLILPFLKHRRCPCV